MGIPCPYAGAQSIQGIVGDGYRFLGGTEGGYTADGTEDLFLEDSHFIIALEKSGFNIVSVIQPAVLVEGFSAAEHFGAFLFAYFQVAEDFIVLIFRSLRSHHHCAIQGIPHLNGFCALDDLIHEFVINIFMYQYPAGAGAYFSLVEGEHHRSFYGLIEKIVIGIAYRFEEYIGTLAAQLHRYRDEVLRSI